MREIFYVFVVGLPWSRGWLCWDKYFQRNIHSTSRLWNGRHSEYPEIMYCIIYVVNLLVAYFNIHKMTD